MSFWEKIRNELKKGMEEGWLVVKDGAKVAAEKGGEMAKVGRLKYQIYSLHKKAEKHLTAIGEKVYDISSANREENPLSNPEIINLIEDIKKIEEEIKGIEKEIETLKKVSAKETPE